MVGVLPHFGPAPHILFVKGTGWLFGDLVAMIFLGEMIFGHYVSEREWKGSVYRAPGRGREHATFPFPF